MSVKTPSPIIKKGRMRNRSTQNTEVAKIIQEISNAEVEETPRDKYFKHVAAQFGLMTREEEYQGMDIINDFISKTMRNKLTL
jgi:hypothetical protein